MLYPKNIAKATVASRKKKLNPSISQREEERVNISIIARSPGENGNLICPNILVF